VAAAPGLGGPCADPRPIPDGAEVVLALDGSFSQEATAVVAAEVGEVPHLDVAGLCPSGHHSRHVQREPPPTEGWGRSNGGAL
jgi:hypothetical protein